MTVTMNTYRIALKGLFFILLTMGSTTFAYEPIQPDMLMMKGHSSSSSSSSSSSERGPRGPRGPKGKKGDKGDRGSNGPKGNQGDRGHKGKSPKGDRGHRGKEGNRGKKGHKGSRGSRGYIGLGIEGPQGPQGPAGATGAAGPTGPTGAGGGTGATGATGASPTGATGAAGATGANGGVLDFADYFALMPGDNSATVAVGTPVEFPQDGPNAGVGITRLTNYTFNLAAVGTYQILFQVSVDEAGQLAVAFGGLEVPQTVVGRATGTSQIVGQCYVTTTVADTVLSIINAPGNSTALTITPTAGGQNPVSAHLVIIRVL